MDLQQAASRVLLGEAIASIAAEYRNGLLHDMGFRPNEASPTAFLAETRRFTNQLCRHLGDRHAGDGRVASALCTWALRVEDYDAFDALLSEFPRFDGRDAVLRRGLVRFPRALTAHWGDAP